MKYPRGTINNNIIIKFFEENLIHVFAQNGQLYKQHNSTLANKAVRI